MLQYWTTESRVKLSSNTSSHKLQGEFLSDVCLNRWRRLAHQSPEERRGPVWAEMHLACQRSEQEVWVVLHWFPLRWVFALTFRRRLETVCHHRRLSGCLGICYVYVWDDACMVACVQSVSVVSLPRQCKHWTNLSSKISWAQNLQSSDSVKGG